MSQKKKTCVLSVKNLKAYIEKIAEAEKDNLSNLEDMDEIMVCYDGDGGGGRFVCEFAFLNNIDRKIKIHPMLIYEGTDTRPNLEVTLGKLTSQIKKLEGEIIIVDGRRLKIISLVFLTFRLTTQSLENKGILPHSLMRGLMYACHI